MTRKQLDSRRAADAEPTLDVPLRARLGQHACALAVMAVGSFGVVALVLSMNRPVPPAESNRGGETAGVVVEPRKPKPRKQAAPPPRRERPRNTPRPNTPPPPAIATSLSSVALGVPDLVPSDMADATAQVVGDAAMRSLVMTEGSVDVPPRPVARSAPAYPPRARARGVTGEVTLRLLVDETGRVEKVKVVEASPAGVFEQSAVDAVRLWRFEPAQYRGRQVRVWARQVLRFKLG